jgi:glycosyltransferase involved in cell wall biosynthesis
MKILFVLPNLDGGGAQKAILNVARGLAERGHETHAIIFESTIEYASLIPADVRLHSLGEAGEKISMGWIGKRLTARKLSRLHKELAAERRFDLIVSTLPFADEVCYLARLPEVWFRIANNIFAEIASLSGASKRARRLARYRSIYEGANLIAVSGDLANDLRNNLGPKKSRIVTIYNPFDLDKIRLLAGEREPGLPPDNFIVYAGRFERQKRFDVLFDAFKKSGLSEPLVLLTNSSPALLAMIRQYGLDGKVIVAGFRQNPYPWYRNANLLVLSSDREGMPNVVIEAMICGCPVASTDCPSGPRELLSGNMKQFLAPCGDAEALAACMRRAVGNRAAFDFSRTEEFRKERAIDAYEQLARKA